MFNMCKLDLESLYIIDYIIINKIFFGFTYICKQFQVHDFRICNLQLLLDIGVIQYHCV